MPFLRIVRLSPNCPGMLILGGSVVAPTQSDREGSRCRPQPVKGVAGLPARKRHYSPPAELSRRRGETRQPNRATLGNPRNLSPCRQSRGSSKVASAARASGSR